MAQSTSDAAVMAQSAARFEGVRDLLARTLGNLMVELDEMRTAWQGAGGRSFEQVRQEWARDQAALHEALGATADALRGASHNYTATDSSAADRVVRSARISLPLGGRS